MSADDIINGLQECGIKVAVSVPCAHLSSLLTKLDSSCIKHIPVTREEEGVGICAGVHLGGSNAALVMQNSGLGNSINALASLDLLYKIPLLMIISHRGVENEKVQAQIPMGELTVPLLNDMHIPYLEIARGDDGRTALIKSWKLAETNETPSALLIKPSYWE